VIGAAQLVVDLRGETRPREAIDVGTSEATASRAGTRRALLAFATIVAYYGLILLVGFRVATLLFLVGFLRFLPGAGWGRIALYTLGMFAVVEGFARLLGMEMPEGVWSVGP
jgi:hypothetical protein